MDVEVGNTTLQGLGRINVIMGKNGCGKSRLLRAMGAQRLRETYSKLRYLPPERFGELLPNSNAESQVRQNNFDDLRNSGNGHGTSRQMSFALLRDSEISFSRRVQETRSYSPETDITVLIDRVNGLLDNIQMNSEGEFIERSNGHRVRGGALSSGESEVVSMALELLHFAETLPRGERGLLVLDEPDVHIHPDLQAKLANLMLDIVRASEVDLLIATHSTSLLSALARDELTHVAFMQAGVPSLQFRPRTEELQRLLPVFGAHPLSQVFHQSTPLMLEGDDDVWLWQQVVRSSNGVLQLAPVACRGVQNMAATEQLASEVLGSVYDHARAVSIRDGDDNPGVPLDSSGCVSSFRLNCYAAENLMLASEVLERCSTDADSLKADLERWVEVNANHSHRSHVESLLASWNVRRTASIKHVRNIVLGLLDSAKPWPVLIGQAIAAMLSQPTQAQVTDEDLANYLGADLVSELRGLMSA